MNTHRQVLDLQRPEYPSRRGQSAPVREERTKKRLGLARPDPVVDLGNMMALGVAEDPRTDRDPA
jgi:hypothetical protein